MHLLDLGFRVNPKPHTHECGPVAYNQVRVSACGCSPCMVTGGSHCRMQQAVRPYSGYALAGVDPGMRCMNTYHFDMRRRVGVCALSSLWCASIFGGIQRAYALHI